MPGLDRFKNLMGANLGMQFRDWRRVDFGFEIPAGMTIKIGVGAGAITLDWSGMNL